MTSAESTRDRRDVGGWLRARQAALGSPAGGGRPTTPSPTRRGAVRRAAVETVEPLERRVLLASTTISSDFAPVSDILVTDEGNIQVSYRTDVDADPKKYFYDNSFDPTRRPSEAGIFLRETTANGAPVVFGAPLHFSDIETPLVADGDQVTANGGNKVTTPLRTPNGAPSPLAIVQSTTYDGFSPYFRVDNAVTNTGSQPATFDFFFAADLEHDPADPGFFDRTQGIVGSDDGSGQDIFFQGGDATDLPDHFQESAYFDVWDAIGGAGNLTDTVTTALPADYDNGMALQWADRTLAPGATGTFSYFVAFDTVALGVPSADLTVGALRNTNNETKYRFEVNYRVDQETFTHIDGSTIGDGDVALRGADGTETAAALVKTAADDEGGFTATYEATRPQGFGTQAYQVVLRPNAVANTAGTPVPAATFEQVIAPAGLQVHGSRDANVLAARLLGPNSGLTVTDVKLNAFQNADGAVSSGFFDNPGGVYNLGSSGIVLSNGDATFYSSDSDLFSESGTTFDDAPSALEAALLNQIAPGPSHQDVTVLTVTFSAQANVTDIFFNLVWGTSESVGTEFLDGFGLVLNGVNIAKTADGAPINVSNPSLAPVSGTALENVVAPDGNPVLQFTNKDPATGAVIPLQATNTLKIVIADTADSEVDSTVFLSALTTKLTPLVPFDPGFGSNGQLQANFVTEDVAFSAAENKLYAVGHNAAKTQLFLARFDDLGKLDPTFDGDGIATLTLGGGETIGYNVVPLPGGGAAVLGEAAGDMLVAKYTPAGTLDAAFGGGDGHAEVDFGGDDTGYGLALDALGRLLLVGKTVRNVPDPKNPTGPQVQDSDYAVARLTPAGTLDASFDGDGKTVVGLDTDTTVKDDQAGTVVVAGGRVVVAGYSDGRVGAVVLTDSGALDTSFGGDGTVTPDLNTTDYTVGLAVQADGKILLAGNSRGDVDTKVGADFGLVRLNADGTDDKPFGLFNGLTGQDLGGADDADAIVLVTDDTGPNIYLVGTSAINLPGTNDQIKTAVARFTGDGKPKPLGDGNGNTATYDGVDATIPAGSLGVGGLSAPGGITTNAVSIATIRNSVSASTDPSGNLLVAKGSAGGKSILRKIGRAIPASPTPTPTTPTPTPTPPVDPRTTRGAAVDTFGAGVDKKKKKVSFTDADGTVVTLTLTGGQATYYRSAGDALSLDVSGTTAKAALTIAAKGGDGRVKLNLINVQSPLKSLVAKTGDLTGGTLFLNGGVGTLDLGSAANATVAVNGNVKTLTVRGPVTGSTIYGGAVFGSDGLRGAFDGAADAFAGSVITKVNVLGPVSGSALGVGVSPGADNVLGTADDQFVGGAASSFKSLKVKGGVDPASTFSVSGTFPKKVALPAKADPLTDARFHKPATPSGFSTLLPRRLGDMPGDDPAAPFDAL